MTSSLVRDFQTALSMSRSFEEVHNFLCSRENIENHVRVSDTDSALTVVSKLVLAADVDGYITPGSIRRNTVLYDYRKQYERSVHLYTDFDTTILLFEPGYPKTEDDVYIYTSNETLDTSDTCVTAMQTDWMERAHRGKTKVMRGDRWDATGKLKFSSAKGKICIDIKFLHCRWISTIIVWKDSSSNFKPSILADAREAFSVTSSEYIIYSDSILRMMAGLASVAEIPSSDKLAGTTNALKQNIELEGISNQVVPLEKTGQLLHTTAVLQITDVHRKTPVEHVMLALPTTASEEVVDFRRGRPTVAEHLALLDTMLVGSVPGDFELGAELKSMLHDLASFHFSRGQEKRFLLPTFSEGKLIRNIAVEALRKEVVLEFFLEYSVNRMSYRLSLRTAMTRVRGLQS